MLVSIFIFITSGISYAQELKGGRKGKSYNTRRSRSATIKRNKTDVFPLERIYRLGGWYVAPGITYMWPQSDDEQIRTIADTTFKINHDPGGKMGLYFELGWFHSFVNPMPFHFIDFGLAYKQLRGTESANYEITEPLAIPLFNEDKSFKEQYLAFHINATHHRHFSRYGFVQNTIGVNYDLNIGSDRSPSIGLAERFNEFPGDQIGQVHYKLGIGWKASDRILVIPSLETPVFTFQEIDGFSSRLSFFNSKYRPFILSIKIMFIRLDPEECNVPNYDGPKNFN